MVKALLNKTIATTWRVNMKEIKIVIYIYIFFATVLGGWIGYEFSRFSLGNLLFSMLYYRPVAFFGSMWFIPYFSTYGVSLFPLLLGYYSLKVSDFGWAERLGGHGVYWLLIYLSRVNQWWHYNNLKMFLMFFVIWVVVLIVISMCLDILY
jgi:NADH-ubiquinone oxidoreductase chain 5